MTTELEIVAKLRDQASAGIRRLDRAVDDLGDTNERSSGKARGMQDVLGQLPLVSLGAAGAVGAAATAVVRFSSDSLESLKTFQAGMAEVFTLLPGLSSQAKDAIMDDVLTLATETGRLPEEIIPALYQSLSAGVPPDNVFAFLRTAADAAKGGVTDLETSVDTITSVVNAYGEEVIDATRTSDVLFTTVRLGKTTFGELGASIAQVTPIAASLNVPLEEIGAAVATITSRGVPTAQTMTQLRSLMAELADSGSEANAILQQQTGVIFPEFINQGGTMGEALAIIRDGAVSAGGRLTDVFARVEAGSAALILAESGAQDYVAALQEMEGAAGATQTAVGEFGGGLEEAERLADAATENLKIMIAEGLEPARLAWLRLKRQIAEAIVEAGEAPTMEEQFVDANELARTTDTLEEYIEAYRKLPGVYQPAREVLEAWFEAQRPGRIAELQRLYNSTYRAIDEGTDVVEEEAETLHRADAARQRYIDGLVAQGGRQEDVAARVEESSTYYEDEAYALGYVDLARRRAIATREAELEALEAEEQALEEAALARQAYQEATGRAFERQRRSTDQTFDHAQVLYDEAAAAGASAAELAALGIAYGQLDPKQAEQLLKRSLIAAEAARLAKLYADEKITLDELREGYATAMDEINNAEYVFSEATGTMLELGEAQERNADEADKLIGRMEGAGDAVAGLGDAAGTTYDTLTTMAGDYDVTLLHNGDDTLEAIEAVKRAAEETAREYLIRYTVVGPGTGGAPGDGPKISEFAAGGYTGDIPENQVAGVVHGREYVLNAATVRRLGGRQALDAVNSGGDMPGGGTMISVNVDARGASDPAAIEMIAERAAQRGVETALANQGSRLDVYRRMR